MIFQELKYKKYLKYNLSIKKLYTEKTYHFTAQFLYQNDWIYKKFIIIF